MPGTFRKRVIGAVAVIGGIAAVTVTGSAAQAAVGDCANADLRRGIAERLPDCRAYEQVSPVKKNGSDVGDIPLTNRDAGGPATTDGSRVAFLAYGAFAGTQWGGAGTLAYLSERGGDSWTTSPLLPRPLDTRGLTVFVNSVTAFNPDMSQSILFSGAGLTPEPPESFNFYHQVNEPPAAVDRLIAFSGIIQGGATASQDLKHLAFATDAMLVPPEPGLPGTGTLKVYEVADGQVRLVSRQPDNTPFSTFSALGNGSPPTTEGTVSDDGRHIFFTGSEGLLEQAVYRRTDGTTTELASPSKRTPVDPNGPQPKTYFVATGDGNRVFFRSAEELTNDANSSAGGGRGDLYRYDFDADELINLSATTPGTAAAEVMGTVDISEDGDRVYFVAAREIGTAPVGGPTPVADQPNLYLWEDDGTPQGETRFIRTLSSDDEAANWGQGSNSRTAQTTASGSHLVFPSFANLTGYDSAGTEQIYRYDADANGGAGAIACLSCPVGNAPLGSAKLPAKTNGGASLGDFPRAMSEDGSRVFFSTPYPLLGRDSNARYDAYMWDDGELFLLSSGRSSDDSYAFGASANGNDAFFRTRESLVPQDGDTLMDLYTARVGGGLESQQAAPPLDCEGDGCQGPSTTPPASSAGSVSNQGLGNVKPAPRCGRFSAKAKRLTAQSKRSSRRSKRLAASSKGGAGSRRAAVLRKRATRLSKQAKTQRAKAKRCKRRAQGAGK